MKIVPKSFGQWDESNLKKLHPKEFRMHEAFYFYELFRISCGLPAYRLSLEPKEDQFLWITSADAFLMMLVSIEEHEKKTVRTALLNTDLYRLIKQLRNDTVHNTVLGARKYKNGANPLVNRIFNLGGSSEHIDPMINIARIRNQLNRTVKNKPKRYHGHIDGARKYLRTIKKQGNEQIILRELFEEALELVGHECGITLLEPVP